MSARIVPFCRANLARRNSGNMIFGFNTDIKGEGTTTYHVQTEVREQERKLESQVFVRGRCVGKRSAPLPSEATDEDVQELARAQHRWVVEAVREGFVEDVLSQEATEELVVQFLGAQRISGEEVELRFRVLLGGFVAGGALVEAHWQAESASGALGTTTTNDAGVAEMRLLLVDGAAQLEVTARLEGQEACRRFLVKSAKI
jgi:hypothetical protein